MEFTKILRNTYGVNEPIFLDDIKRALENYSEQRIFQLLRGALESGSLAKFDKGIYYIPTQTILGKSKLNVRKVLEKKYLVDTNGRLIGFYSGWGLLNSIGGTTQMANTLEVVSNKETTRVREIKLGNRTFIIRKPRIKVNEQNVRPLQILELCNQFTIDEDVSRAIQNYAKINKLQPKDILQYAKFYPAKAIKNVGGILYGLA
jgi:hypothetical protein